MSSTPDPPKPSPPMAERSLDWVVSATRQPSPSSPRRSSSWTQTSSRNTSLKDAPASSDATDGSPVAQSAVVDEEINDLKVRGVEVGPSLHTGWRGD